jgi:hypothetical protein
VTTGKKIPGPVEAKLEEYLPQSLLLYLRRVVRITAQVKMYDLQPHPLIVEVQIIYVDICDFGTDTC